MEHPSKEMGGQQGTEAELIRRARSGDSSAQQDLWRAHRRWVAAIILAHRPRSIEVDDLMQEVALKLISRLDSLRDPSAFRPWLRQIVINVCRGAARGLKPTLHFAQNEGAEDTKPDHHLIAMPSSGGPSAGEVVSQNDAAKRLLEQALTLPSEYREPLLLRCVRSLTYQQISELLNLPITTIETRLARARRMLREEIGEEIIAEELT